VDPGLQGKVAIVTGASKGIGLAQPLAGGFTRERPWIKGSVVEKYEQ
jgi:hypothetical protein